ncbi:polysaccharide biosynthesis protein [Candidatus Pseudothioglobus sp. Uisw_016]|uniref:polysaccharide biosynthesis protein n=1 Tax=Candidatus Pseudothioglobus sp. Uisw_016 TaxID=3230995 RepID=UPI003A8A6C02
MLRKIIHLSRVKKQIIMSFCDAIIIVFVLLMAFSLRLGEWYAPEGEVSLIIFGAPLIAIPVFIQFGLYRAIIRYIDFKALWSVVKAVSLYALIWGVITLMAAIDSLPRSVILINWVLSILLIGGLRIFAHAIFSRNFKLSVLNIQNKNNQKRVLIYGAGEAGIQLSSALGHSSEFNLVGFVDDAKELHGKNIRGLNIYSANDICNIIERLKVEELLLAIPSASRSKRVSIINALEPYSVIVRMLPGVSELAKGKVSVGDLREVSMDDLLGRDSVQSNKKLLGKNITNKVVMVTGAGGSIGSELCRQIKFLKPKLLILYEMSEFALYEIEKELLISTTINITIYPILGSVNNRARLENIFSHFGVNTIYHAAAYKHVPMVEYNNTEGINNNIFGTLNCAQAAISTGVETFVLISTDKAVRPTNTMGATKRFAELVLQALSSKNNNTLFSIVRFGNVLGSSGSVIPLFKKQIKNGGPVTVTDPNIIRYFMTITEAVELVIQSGSMGEGGDVFVLDMGEQVKIDDLAKKMIKLSGLQIKDDLNPDGDIEIKYTGLRPGEKLFEELLIGKNTSETDNPRIMRAKEEMMEWTRLEGILDELRIAINENNYLKLRELLIQAVPLFKPQCDIIDILYKKIE